MPSMSQAKTLGEVGSILVVLTAIPSIGGLLGIAGFILILLAIKDISEVVADKSIYHNMLVSIVFAIAGVIIGTLVVVGSVFRFIGLASLTGPNYFGSSFNPSTIPTGDWIGFIMSIIVGLTVIWVMMIVSAFFVRKSYNAIASKLNIGMFGTAGLVYLIGAATTIILVGFVILFIAQILLIVAFFSIDDRTPVISTQPIQPTTVNP
ncbi:MAG: DUF996 domain-containing protein [Candidatus Bathyarchaeia archaeon]